jgi:hypothetical protein
MADRWLRMRTAFRDSEFHGEWKKLTGQDSDPLMPEEIEKPVEKRRAMPS